MKNLVNIRSGKVVAEIAEGKYNSVCETVVGEKYELDNATMSVKIDGKWHDYYDLAAEVVMKYRDYKNSYSDCKTKKDSYDGETKTVTVFVQDDDVREWKKA